MKRLHSLFAVGMLLLLMVSCKKDNSYTSNNTAAIQVVNGVIGLPSLMLKMNNRLNSSGLSSSNISKVNFGNAAFFYAQRQNTAVDILSGVDSSKLTGTTFNFGSSSTGAYSLFITGTSSSSIETVLVEEASYPYTQLDKIPASADSVINVRFVNLSPNTSPLDIRIQGGSSNEVTGMAYKGYSPFKAYTAKVANTNYKFEIVEGSTVLLTYTFNVTTNNRFKNVALVIRGLKSGTGTNALTVSAVNYFQ